MADRAEYRILNPLGTVPAIQYEDMILTESTAILLWMAQKYPEFSLLPSDLNLLAEGVEFLSWLSSTVHIARRQAQFPARFSDSLEDQASIKKNGEEKLMKCFDLIDRKLLNKSWVLGGDKPSACDYQLMVYVNWCAVDGISLTPWPDLQRWTSSMLQQDEVKSCLAVIRSPLCG